MKLQIGLCTAVLVMAVVFAARKALDPSRREPPPPPAAAWAKLPPKQWPQIVLTHEAQFRKGRDLSGASACLFALPDGNVFGVTARSIVGGDGMITRASQSTIRDWRLHPPLAPDAFVEVVAVFGDKYDNGPLVALEIETQAGQLPVRPLQLRTTPVVVGERVFIVGASSTETNSPQQVCAGTVTDPFFGGLNGTLDEPVNLSGFTGAPIVDTNGLLVALMTRSNAEPDRQGRHDTFTGCASGTLRPLLQSLRPQWHRRPQPRLDSAL